MSLDIRIIVNEKLDRKDNRLGRHVQHDSESRKFAFNTTGLVVKSVVHKRNIPILDQGQVGSCTANAGIGCLGTDPMFSVLPSTPKYSLNESGALKLYSDEEVMDGNGTYPPNDDGSSGLTTAKVLQNAGLISGYQHTFTMDDALKALSVTPILFGTNWYNDMFNPDADGRVHPTGSIAGGHEILSREVDAPNQRIWFDNSWGLSYGVQGRFYLTFEDFNVLLNQQGDVTILLPLAVAPPKPTPPAPNNADVMMASAAKAWLKAKGLN